MKYSVPFACLLVGLVGLICLTGCQKSSEQAEEDLLRQGISLTPDRFIQAASESDTLTLERMMVAGMDVNTTVADGRTALIAAASGNQVHAMKLLTARGASPSAVMPDGRNALHVAAANGHTEATRFLLNLKLSANQPDRQGRSPLVEAAANNNLEVIKLLLASSTDEQIQQNSSAEPHPPALPAAKEITNDTLVSKAEAQRMEPPVKTVPAPAVSPVAGALENGHEDLALQLLESGVDFKDSRIHGQPILAWSIAAGQSKIFYKLLEMGADPDIRLQTPASDAFTAKVANEKFHYYLKQDGNISVLMMASALGEAGMVDALLLKGAQKNIRTTKHKTTAIYLAGVNRHSAIVQLLLGKSSKPEDQRYKIEVSLSKQKATIYKNGTAVLYAPISSGRKGFSTPKGTFVITNKYKDWVSTIYDSEMPYFLRLNCGPVGLHAGALPGYPASHGCIRLPYEKAREFYGTVDVGTIVSIVD